MEFGESLRSARESQNMTQQQVADALGVDKSTYCGYETGKRQPDVKKIKQLSAILRVSTDVLLDTQHCSVVRNDDFTFAMHDAARDLTEQDKKLLIDMANRLRKTNQK